jgi:hypothetical protein
MLDEPIAEDASEGAVEKPLRCDFCGQAAPRVRRVALDGVYDRLQKPHHAQYACAACSDTKERERLDAS